MLQDKYQGLEYTGVWEKPKKAHIRGRAYIVGNRVYNTLVGFTSAEKTTSENATKFLDSFKVQP